MAEPARYEKHFDETYQCAYFYDKVAGESVLILRPYSIRLGLKKQDSAGSVSTAI